MEMNNFSTFLSFNGPLILSFLIIIITFSYFFLFQQRNSQIIVTNLLIYPIKSCQGIKLKQSKITSKGFLFDRQFALMNDMQEVLTLRSRPKLATITPSFNDDYTKMILFGPNNQQIEILLEENEEEEEEKRNIKKYLKLRIWNDIVDVYEVDTKISEWFSQILDGNIKFVRISSLYKRETNKKYIENILTLHIIFKYNAQTIDLFIQSTYFSFLFIYCDQD